MSEILFKLQEQGASIVPIVEGKQSWKGWPELGIEPLTKEDLEEVIKGQFEGYAIMMGRGGFNCIDFDSKNMPEDIRSQFFPAVWEKIPEHLRVQLPAQTTRNGGAHLIYKCAVSASEKRSIENPVTGRPVLETLTSKGYCMVPPSPGYQVVSGSLATVPEISKEDHELLWKISSETALSFLEPYTAGKTEISRTEIDLLFEDDDSCTNISTAELQSNHAVSAPQNSKPPAKPRTSSGSKLKANPKETKPNNRSIQFISASATHIERTGIDITADYKNWTQIGYAIAYEMGEAGRENFHKFSANHPKYNADECDKTYSSILTSASANQVSNPITGATLRHILKENGVVIPDEGGNKTALKTNYAIEYIRSKGLNRNMFTNRIEKPSGDPITESDVDTILIDLHSQGFSVSKAEVGSIINSYYVKQTNPLKEWLQSTVAFADKTALDSLLDSLVLKVDAEDKVLFYRKLVTKWLLQIPAMIFDNRMPRLVLVLIGGTYIGKSEFFRRLLPKQLDKYYAESALNEKKDSKIMMTEHLLINIDELAGLMKSPKDVEEFKTLSSATNFTLRTPYGRLNEKFQRKAILCGTSNKIDVIQDHDTGNSRIIPLELISIDQDLYNSILTQELFGELVRLYQEVGAEYLRLTPEELNMLQLESGDYTALNVEQELILRFFRIGQDFMTATEITDYVMRHTNQQITSKKIARELLKLGFKKDRKRVPDLDGTSRHLHGYYVEKVEVIPSLEDVKNSIIRQRMVDDED